MRINLRQVEAFRAVFQTGSMSAAGALMGVTQPAISRLIRDLEAEIRLPLFDRKAGKVTVTPDGVALYREVQRSFHGLDRIARFPHQLQVFLLVDEKGKALTDDGMVVHDQNLDLFRLFLRRRGRLRPGTVF